MPWEVLDDYDLPNLPAHLLAARRWDDLRDTVFDVGYLRAVVARFGILALTRILGGVADNPEVAIPLRAQCADLRDLIADEAGFLSAPQYAGLPGPFRNHLDVACARRGHPPLSGGPADSGQQGWLDLVARTGPATRRAARFFMPGHRESFVATLTYTSGPAGAHTELALDPRRMRLLGETISYSDNDYDGLHPVYYHWRSWDLRSGALLIDQSGSSAKDRPSAFDAPELVWGQGRRDWARGSTLLECANGTELLVAEPDDAGAFRCVVTDHERRTVFADAETSPTFFPQAMIKLDDRYLLFGVGRDDHIYRVDLDDGPAGLPDIGRPYPPPEDDPVIDLGLSWRSDRGFESTSGVAPPHTLEHPKDGYGSRMVESAHGMIQVPCGLVVEPRTFCIGVWESATGRWLGELAATPMSTVGGDLLRGIAVSPEGRHIISANPGTRVCVWDVGKAAWPRREKPDWVLGGIVLPDPVVRLAFLRDGGLVAVVTENHELLVLRFRADSAILARIGLDEELARIITDPAGSAITCVGRSGAVSSYRFRYVA